MPSSNESKAVLLIEDNVDDEHLTLRALRRNNVMNEVVVAGDGEEGLDFLFGEGKFAGRDSSLVPAVVILDLKLPGLSGLDVLKRIRGDARTSRIPVVVLTSSEDRSLVHACYEAGANSYIHKPTDISEYSDVVLQIAMYWLLLNRLEPGRILI
jgi:CheY-like chemotaxis protein